MSTRDVVVIGGGLLGSIVTWMLARDGADVVLLERDQINAHASGQNAGSLHFQLEYRMIERGLDAARQAAAAMPLHLDAAAMWSGLGVELGEDLGVTQKGGLMLAEDDTQARLLEAKCEIERTWGLDVRLLSAAETQQLAPYLSSRVIAASYCPIEGKADTRIAGPAFVRGALRIGADVRTRTHVTAIERVGANWRITAQSVDRNGEMVRNDIETRAVVIVAGVWTTEVGRMCGATLPTIPLALTMTVTTKTAPFIPHLVQHAGTRLSLKQSHDGNVLIGGGWPARLMTNEHGQPDFTRRPALLPDSVAGNAAAALRVVPALSQLHALRTWVGTTTITPDQLPLVGAVPGAPGVFVATGGSAFTLGPSFARVLADLIQGRTPHQDISPYHPARFEVSHA